MKKLFKKLLAVALVGAMVGFVGCKDYDDDIDALNNRLDGIENNQIKGINDQIASMQSSISSLQSAQSATQAAVETLKATVATLTAKHDADIQDLKGADIELQAQISVLEAAIKALEAKDADLQAQIDSINETMKTMASMSWVEATLEAYATSEEVAAAIGELEAWLGEVGIRLANLESQVTELQILGDEHAKAIDAANAKIEALQAQLDKAVEDLMAWVGEQLSGYITASYFEGYMTEYTAKIVSTLEEISNAIEDDYKEYTDEAVKNAVEAFKAQVVATLEEMSNAIEADRARDLEALKEQIVATLEEMSNAIEADRKRDLTALQEAIVAQLEEMSNAIEADRARDIQDALDKVVAQLEETSNAIEHDYKEYADAVVAQLRDDVVNTLMEMSAGIEADMEKLKGVIEENYTAAIQAALDQVVATLEEMSNAIEADRARDLAALKEQVVATLEEMSNAIEADYKKEIAAAIENNNGVLRAEFTEAMAELSKTLDSFIEEIQKQMLATKINVNALMNRIQSIVYVPEYSDHKATVPAIIVPEIGESYVYGYKYPNALLDYEVLAQGQVSMTFQVTPATAASKLVALGKDIFHFEFEAVKTRAAEAGLELLEVKAAEGEGRFTVIAQPTLPKEFFNTAVVKLPETAACYYLLLQEQDGFEYTNTSYSVALHLQAADKNEAAAEGTKTDIVSNYVNLTADIQSLLGIKVGKSANRPVNAVSDYEIAWDDVETEIALLEGYEPYLEFDGDEYSYISYAELAKTFDMPELKKWDISNKAYKADNTAYAKLDDSNFKLNHGQQYECDEVVSLAKPEKKFLGDYLNTVHYYYFGEDSDPILGSEINTTVTIIKPTRTIKGLNKFNYWWNYADYLKKYDVAKSSEEINDDYEGSDQAFKLYVDRSAVSDEILDQDIFAAPSKTYIYNEETGKYENTNPTAVTYDSSHKDEDGLYYPMKIFKWDFNKAYKVRVEKDLDDMIVRIEFDTEFVGLPEKLTYAIEKDAEFAYDGAKEIFLSDTVSMVEDLFAAVNEGVAAKFEGAAHFAKVEEFVESINKAMSGTYRRTLVDFDAEIDAVDAEALPTVITNKDKRFVNRILNKTLDGGPYSGIAYLCDDAMDVTFQLAKKDVAYENDTYSATTTIVPGYGMPIEVTAKGSIVMPLFAVEHNPFWVGESSEAYKYFTQVRGIWSPEGMLAAVTSFSTQKVDLNDAFIVKKFDGSKWVEATAAEIAAQGIKLSFKPEETIAGISIGADNMMTYNGFNMKDGNSVHVIGSMKIGDVQISKAFTSINDYSAYRVFGYDPIGDFKTTGEKTIETSKSAPYYADYVTSHLSLKDVRGFELIDPTKTTAEPWIMGTGSMDPTKIGAGYKDTFVVKAEFMFEPLEIEYVVLDANGDETHYLDKHIKVNTDKTSPDFGFVEFSNINEIALQQDATVVVTVTLNYPWGPEKMGVVNYYLKK